MKARLPRGMGGGPQNMNAMIKQAQKMQADMEALQEDLDAREYEIAVGGGVVGDIKPEIVDPEDIETLQDTLVAAVNQAIKKVEETNSAEMQKITGDINVPGLI